MNQRTGHQDGVNAQSLEIKGFEITFDHETAGMTAGQFRQSRRRVESGNGKSPLFEPQQIPTGTAPDVENVIAMPKMPDKPGEKTGRVNIDSFVVVLRPVGTVIINGSHFLHMN
jgi:hypothetical protein